MAGINKITCNDCGHEFRQSSGHGFYFLHVRCGDCGESKRIETEERAYKHNPKPLGRARFTPPAKQDDLPEDEGYGLCSCGGVFLRNAEIRCEKCGSVDVEVEDRGLSFC